MAHIESFFQAGSQASPTELKGFPLKWKRVNMFFIHIDIYLDILAPIRQLNFSFRQKLYNPV